MIKLIKILGIINLLNLNLCNQLHLQMDLLLYLNKIKIKSHNRVIQVGGSAMTMILHQLLDHQNRNKIMAGTMILLMTNLLENNNLVVVLAEEAIGIMIMGGIMVGAVATLEAEVAEIIM